MKKLLSILLLPGLLLVSPGGAVPEKEHYNLHYILQEDKENNPMRPHKAAKILTLLLSLLSRKEK